MEHDTPVPISDDHRAAVEDFARREAAENLQHRIDFLVGNAPEVPRWFKPIMSGTKPEPFWKEEHHKQSNHAPANQADIEEWNLRHERERDLQWPLWWALEQIKRIDKPRPHAIVLRDREPGKPDSGPDYIFRIPYTTHMRVVNAHGELMGHCIHGRSLHPVTLCHDCESELANDTRRVQLSENTKARLKLP